MIFYLVVLVCGGLWVFGTLVVADAYVHGSLMAGIIATLLWIMVGAVLLTGLREGRR